MKNYRETDREFNELKGLVNCTRNGNQEEAIKFIQEDFKKLFRDNIECLQKQAIEKMNARDSK